MDRDVEIDVMEMGKRLVEARAGRTQDEVASALGISKAALSMYENGGRIPRDPIKVRISRYYRKPITYLFFNLVNHET